ncbi:MAG: hypothetical protein V4726_08540 [Verrucomicrobiota bacterium]
MSTHVSLWWLLVPVILFFVIGLYFRRPPEGKRTDSRVLGKGIADAVTQFYGDYNRLPKPPSFKDGQDSSTDTSAAGGLIQILFGKEPDNDAQQNTRKINYLEGMKAAKARSGTRNAEAEGSDKWIGGLVLEEGRFEAVDGWGNYYRIRLDSNYDGEMINPNADEVDDGREKLPNRVIIWSPGKDGKWETWSDNLKSWD